MSEEICEKCGQTIPEDEERGRKWTNVRVCECGNLGCPLRGMTDHQESERVTVAEVLTSNPDPEERGERCPECDSLEVGSTPSHSRCRHCGWHDTTADTSREARAKARVATGLIEGAPLSSQAALAEAERERARLARITEAGDALAEAARWHFVGQTMRDAVDRWNRTRNTEGGE